jgi:glutaredoxin
MTGMRRLYPIGQVLRKLRAFPGLVPLCIFLLTAPTPASADIYKWIDADGRVQLSDRPPVEGGAEEVELPPINTYEAVSIEVPEGSQDSQSRRPQSGGSKKVVMYSASWCGVCARARRFFQAGGIPFRELDVEKSPKTRRELKRMKATGVPVILVGSRRMNGFSEEGFMGLYRN